MSLPAFHPQEVMLAEVAGARVRRVSHRVVLVSERFRPLGVSYLMAEIFFLAYVGLLMVTHRFSAVWFTVDAQGEWVDGYRAGFVRQNETREWFTAVDMTLGMVFAALGVYPSSTELECCVVGGLVASALCVYLVAVLVLRPFHSTLNAVFFCACRH
jgi:hypothetical protein